VACNQEVKRQEIRIGNSAAMQHGIIKGDANGCPRVNLIRCFEGQPIVSDRRSLITFAVGTALENVVFSWLKAEYGDSIKADVAMEEQITDNVWVVGHADFVWKLPDGRYKIGEHKSCSSVGVVEKVFVERHYKPNNLAQLCHYLLVSEATEGELIYTSAIYCKRSETKAKCAYNVKAGDQAIFKVRIADNGAILVDESPAPFDVSDLLQWREYQAELIENRRLDAPPESWEATPWPVCQGCAFQEVCEKYDTCHDDVAFWGDVRELIAKAGKR
jgi:hypothetical protein